MKVVEEFHEFTWDMIKSLPKAYYFQNINLPYQVKCKPGLKSVYYFSSDVEEVERFDAINDNVSYNLEPPYYTESQWSPPPIKDHFKNKISFNKPVVVIQNKFALEWSQGVFNYFTIEVLGELFGYLKEKYDIVYIRPTGKAKDYYTDENEIKEFEDYAFIKKEHPEVYTIEDFTRMYPDMSYNTLQFMIEASSERHITVSGGNACIASYFGGDVMIFDSPQGIGAGRGIWKTDSWLKLLSGANILGFNSYKSLIKEVKNRW